MHTSIFPTNTRLVSAPTMSLKGKTEAPVWWADSRKVTTCPDAGLCPTAPCDRYPVGQQEVHEDEHLDAAVEDTSAAFAHP